MSKTEKLKFDQKSHFAFGKNWQNFLRKLTPEKIELAKVSLDHLVGKENITGSEFLDIGCGSGLHSLSALNLGAKYLEAFDFDEDSVKGTQELLKSKWTGNAQYKVYRDNILRKSIHHQFDIVYSWGVLHHTGAMWEAIESAAKFTKANGLFTIAVYQKTRLCWAWKIYKKMYMKAPDFIKRLMELDFSLMKQLKLLLTGTNPRSYIRNYEKMRGMDWYHDIVDWLGGYPYESASPEEVVQFVENLGFDFIKGQRLNKSTPIGFFGSGCGEYVFRRKNS